MLPSQSQHVVFNEISSMIKSLPGQIPLLIWWSHDQLFSGHFMGMLNLGIVQCFFSKNYPTVKYSYTNDLYKLSRDSICQITMRILYCQ